MPGTSALSKVSFLVGAIALCAMVGCTEFAHMGRISDREAAGPVNSVKIEQLRPDGTWKQLGRTDGHGYFQVYKHEIVGGGRIRLSKPGYHTLNMSESEFLMENSMLMSPTSDPSDNVFGNH